jgi:phosphopantothenoylcysteine decarboxylase/phosphopantothenate--cysteine ligase
MQCVVTAGPTAEALDRVRRLTNISSGRLGVELANHLIAKGHAVTLLRGEQATWCGACRAAKVQGFTSTTDLRERLQNLRTAKVDALFHAAAVSDFTFGKVWTRSAEGTLSEREAAKFSTREGVLLAELVPTPKIIAELRDWFAGARLVGWKYEVDGDRAKAVQTAQAQLATCRTDACVANGPGYGKGFGLVTAAGRCTHLEDRAALFAALEAFIRD